jgi:hypothetical protein
MSCAVIDVRDDGKRVYGSKAVAEWVKDKKPKIQDVVNNADSYTQFVNGLSHQSPLTPVFKLTRISPSHRYEE